jgi:two-component system, OmpR family, sensor kinase
MRLHRRLMVSMAVLLVIGLAITDIVTYASLRSFLFGKLDDQLDSSQRLAVHYLDFAAHRRIQPDLRHLDYRVSPEVYVILLARTGRTILRRPSGFPGHPNPRPIVPRAVRLSPLVATSVGPFRPNPNSITLTSVTGSEYRAQAATVPQGTVITAIPLLQTNETMSSLVRIEGAVSVAVLLALCGLAVWTVRRGLRPLDDMAKTANAIASGDLSRRVVPSGDESEVGRLGSALNVMLTQIEAGFAETSASAARLRQFVADASHELRTPLTSIRGYAELLRKGVFPSEGERLRALRRIEHEASRMGGLVDDLLLLARLDQGRPLERMPVDLRRVCRDAVDDAVLADPDRPIELVAPEPVTVAGDRDRIAQVAHNLVRNALVHTPPGTPVRVEVATEGAMGTARVVDEGPGLTAVRLSLVFDRFYRADPSRTGEGTGLGLSIVRAIAEALGGRAWAEPGPRRGTMFCVSLPLYSAGGSGPPGPDGSSWRHERRERERPARHDDADGAEPSPEAVQPGDTALTGAATNRATAPRAPGRA